MVFSFLPLLRKRPKHKVWTTKTGEQIKICKMTDSHLINCIKMIERMAISKCSKAISIGYHTLSTLQGECAIDSIEDDLWILENEGLDPSLVHPLYNDLCEEANRRELDY